MMNMKLEAGVLAAKARVDALIEHMVRNGENRGRADGVWEVSESSAARLFGEGENLVREDRNHYTVVLYCSMFGTATFYEWALSDVDILLQKINATVDSWEEQVYARWPKQKETLVA